MSDETITALVRRIEQAVALNRQEATCVVPRELLLSIRARLLWETTAPSPAREPARATSEPATLPHGERRSEVMRVYIAGPMRGYPEHNIPAFRRAAELFRAVGHEVVSPVEVGEKLGGQDSGLRAEDYVRADLFGLLTCNGIALLEGWEQSTGARCEASVAVTLGFKFFDPIGNGIEAPTRIHICGGYERAPGSVDTLDSLRDEVTAWANATFPHAKSSSKAEHLRREAVELCDAPTDAEEMADIFILLSHISDGADLVGAIRAKLEKNKRRKWGVIQPDGVVEHIREEASA